MSCNSAQQEASSKQDIQERKVEIPQKKASELEILWEFEVGAEKVFDAFTRAEDMNVWWTPTTSFDINLELGGSWTIRRTEGEEIYTATGQYLEIEAPHRLRYTYSMPQFSPNTDTISIDIHANKKGSSLVYKVSGPDIAQELASTPKDSISQSE
ncbi:MAG: SRPBCC domain-containing protein, partial [Bacteroidota bacterium]